MGMIKKTYVDPIVDMYLDENLTVEEIAQAMDIPEADVKAIVEGLYV